LGLGLVLVQGEGGLWLGQHTLTLLLELRDAGLKLVCMQTQRLVVTLELLIFPLFLICFPFRLPQMPLQLLQTRVHFCFDPFEFCLAFPQFLLPRPILSVALTHDAYLFV